MSVGHVKYTPELSTGLLKHDQTWQLTFYLAYLLTFYLAYIF